MTVACSSSIDDNAKTDEKTGEESVSVSSETDAGDVAACNESNSTGCCTDDGECRTPRSQWNYGCGLGGVECVECSAAQTCDILKGQCVDPSEVDCNANTCPGCCSDEGRCQFPNAQGPLECGLGGGACITCTGAQVCDPNQNACIEIDDIGCGPATCPGCCDEAGECVDRQEQDAQGLCGIAGNECIECAEGLTCQPETTTCVKPEDL